MIDTLHFQFLAVHTLFQRIFLRNLRKHYPELLPGQPKVIDFLLTVESAYQKEIADACLMEPATLCLILEKMEYSGLVKREKLPDNRKNIVVSLTGNRHICQCDICSHRGSGMPWAGSVGAS